MGTVALKTPPREARRDPLVDNPALAEAVRIGWITPAEIVSDEPPPRLPGFLKFELGGLHDMD